jgi:hypothetical protein
MATSDEVTSVVASALVASLPPLPSVDASLPVVVSLPHATATATVARAAVWSA